MGGPSQLEAFVHAVRTGSLSDSGLTLSGADDGTSLLVLPSRRRVWNEAGDEILDLRRSRVMFELFYALADAGQPVSAKDLYERAWGLTWGLNRRNSLYVAINRLRAKLANLDLRVETPGEGLYELAPAVRVYKPGGEPTEEASSQPPPGREPLIRDLERWVGRRGLMTLTGPGGIGKTAVARWFADRRPGKVVWIDLSSTRTVGELIAAIAARVRGDDVDSFAASFAELGRSLVVLDGAEGVSQVLADVLPGMMARAPEIAVLLTSRSALDISLEERLVVEALPVEVSVEVLKAAAPANAGLDDDVARALAELLEGLPLALELAARRMADFPPRDVLQRLSDPLRVLVGGPRDAAARHRTIAATLDGSWSLLRPWAQEALLQLAPLSGGFTMELAEHVLNLSGQEKAPWADRAIAKLAAWSWLQRDGRRYKMFTVTRDYIRSRGARPDAAKRAAEWLLSGVGASGESAAGRRWLEQERDNLLHLHDETAATFPDIGARLALALTRVHGYTGSELYDRLSEAVAPTDSHVAAELAVARGAVLVLQGRYREAQSLLEEGRDQAQALGAIPIVVRATIDLGALSDIQDHSTQALAYAEQALKLAEQSGDRALLREATHGMGMAHHSMGDFEQATAYLRRAAALCRRAGAPEELNIRASLGAMLLRMRRLEEAEEQVERGYQIAGGGDVWRADLSSLHSTAGLLDALQGRAKRGLERSRHALLAARNTTNRIRIGVVAHRHALVAIEGEAYDEALEAARLSIAQWEHLGNERQVMFTELVRTWALARSGQTRAARRELKEVTALWPREQGTYPLEWTQAWLDGTPDALPEPETAPRFEFQLMLRWACGGPHEEA